MMQVRWDKGLCGAFARVHCACTRVAGVPPLASCSLGLGETSTRLFQEDGIGGNAIAWSPDHNLLAFGCNVGCAETGPLSLWDLSTRTRLRKLDATSINGVKFTKDLLIAAERLNKVSIWDLTKQNSSPLYSIDMASNSQASWVTLEGLDVSTHEEILAVAEFNPGRVSLVNLSLGSLQAYLPCEDDDAGLSEVPLPPWVSDCFSVGMQQAEMQGSCTDPAEGENIRKHCPKTCSSCPSPSAAPKEFTYPGQNIYDVAFHPTDPDILVVCGGSESSGFILLQNIQTGTVRQLDGHKQRVYSVSFSALGGLLASGSEDGSVKIWNTNSLQLVHQLRIHSKRVKNVA